MMVIDLSVFCTVAMTWSERESSRVVKNKEISLTVDNKGPA